MTTFGKSTDPRDSTAAKTRGELCSYVQVVPASIRETFEMNGGDHLSPHDLSSPYSLGGQGDDGANGDK